MKKTIIYGILALVGASLSSCDDFLNDNRFPLDTQYNNPDFWNSEVNVQGQVDNLYNYFFGYGNTTGRNGTFYFESTSDDQVGIWSSSVQFNNWKYLVTPGSNTDWNNDYDRIRNANYIIENVQTSTLHYITRNSLEGQARLVRAYWYFDLVRKFGDVPLVLEVLAADSEQLYMARTPRNQVIDQAVADLDYAIANISKKSAKYQFSQDLANAVKAEVCLFEASYARYHANDEARAKKFYDATITACEALMGSSYELCENYADLYNSTYSEIQGIPALTANKEVIFMKPYNISVKMHSLVKYTNTGEILGMSRDAFESYLFLDGKPMSQQTDKMDTGIIPVLGKDKDGNDIKGQLNIANCLAVRDKRLAATIDDVVFYQNYTWKRANGTVMHSKSGYGVKKFWNENLNLYQATTDGQSFTCAPLYWLAEIYLAYAEAKAELGTINNDDLNKTINKLFTRAGLPTQTVAGLSAINDPANNMGISSLLWEIRRCRRCELMFDKGQRYWDLIRWHQLEVMDNVKYPKTTQGAYVQPALDEDHFIKNTNGYMDFYQGSTREYNVRNYFYPIGTNEIVVNPAIKQNEGWDTPKQ